MDRFAFKIDKALKANLYKICRLCGIDQFEKVPIIVEGAEEIIVDEHEPSLRQKIVECLGLLIAKDDKMPQTICTLCVDKLNDFYEFREMCYATNIQTRKLLGLKEPKINKALSIKSEVDIKHEPLAETSKSLRKRKTDEAGLSKASKVESIKSEDLSFTDNHMPMRKKVRLIDSGVTQKRQMKSFKSKEDIKVESDPFLKFKQLCNICDERFISKLKLDRHQATSHVPNIQRYFCTTCNEGIKKGTDIKSHQLWHKLSKTPHTCPICGETFITFYSYSKHMRDHSQSVPRFLLVLDRECPQCRETFATNFLYNTHPCAVRTKKCAGCDRQLRTEIEYMRHAAMCPKIYHNYSTHIPDAAVIAETCVRIKNENDVEAAAEADGHTIDEQSGMKPVVMLSRLSASPSIGETSSTSAHGKSQKKGGRKGFSIKNLKRVDDLLKSTMDALCSIKHEPEMDVDTDTAAATEEYEDEPAEDNDMNCDDFHDGDDESDDETANERVSIQNVAIKKELIDESYNDIYSNDEASASKDTTDPSNSIAKIPMIKIKIKKEHGQLNSSFVDECAISDKRKKKKKRKERTKDEMVQDSATANRASIESSALDTNSSASINVACIKQERLDIDESYSSTATDPLPAQAEATVMTSIPFMQFQISCISSGVEFNDGEADHPEQDSDVKPNRLELDRMMQDLQQEHEGSPATLSSAGDEVFDSPSALCNEKNTIDTGMRLGSGKAFKSTGGIRKQTHVVVPEIVAVSSGSNVVNQLQNEPTYVAGGIVIKSEPQDPEDNLAESNTFSVSEVTEHPDSECPDYRDIVIKQEPDIDIPEVHFETSVLEHGSLFNGTQQMHSIAEDNNNVINKSSDGQESDDDFDDSDLDGGDDEEEEEEREYRELEMPPPIHTESNISHENENDRSCVFENDLRATSGNSDANEDCLQYDSNAKAYPSSNLSSSTQTSADFKITNVTSGCYDHFAADETGDLDKSEQDKSNKIEENEEKVVESLSPAEAELSGSEVTDTIDTEINASKDVLLEARPFSDHKSNATSTENLSYHSNDVDSMLTASAGDGVLEEQQNILNHEMLEASVLSTEQDLSSAGGTMKLDEPRNYDEETENLINECADATLRQLQQREEVVRPEVEGEQQPQQDQNGQQQVEEGDEEQQQIIRVNQLRLDDSNINEIAENNNNANIERERDDNAAAVAAALAADGLVNREPSNTAQSTANGSEDVT